MKVNQLREQLKADDTRIVSLTRYPNKKKPGHTLTVVTPLTLELAESLQCKNQFYTLNDEPIEFKGSYGLMHKVSDSEMEIPIMGAGFSNVFPHLIYSFLIKWEKEPMLYFRIVFQGAGMGALLNGLMDVMNDNPFDLVLGATQRNLFDSPAAKPDGPGTRVVVGGEEDVEDEWTRVPDNQDEKAVAESDSPLADYLYRNTDEPPVPLVQEQMDSNEEQREAGTLPSLRVMAGGKTSDLKKTKANRRKFDDSVLPVEEPQPA